MLTPGQRVKITEGAFAGMDGIAVAPSEVAQLNPGAAISTTEEGEVWVLISIFGREVPVALSPEWVQVSSSERQ